MGDLRTDEELMVAYRLSDEKAFRELYSRHSAKVFGFLNKHLKKDAEANDVFQNVFLKLHHSRSKYDPKFPFMAWLFTIAKSTLIDFTRKKNRLAEVALDTDTLITNSASSQMDLPIAALPENQRQVIDLRFSQDLSFEEIAALLETTPSNVRQILSRGVRRLRSLLKSRGDK